MQIVPVIGLKSEVIYKPKWNLVGPVVGWLLSSWRRKCVEEEEWVFFLIILLKQQLTSNYSCKWACTSKLQYMMPGGKRTLFNIMYSDFSWRQVEIWLVVWSVQQMLESMQWHHPGWWERDFLELWQAVAGLIQWPNWKNTTIEGCHNRERSQQHGRVPLC